MKNGLGLFKKNYILNRKSHKIQTKSENLITFPSSDHETNLKLQTTF